MRALRLPEDAAEDAQPGCSLPAWAVGALPNPWLQRHYQARAMRSPACAHGIWSTPK